MSLTPYATQVDPPGFNLIVLPFADDLRDVDPEEESEAPSEAALAAAKKIVNAIALDMESSGDHGISNPVLQKQYSMLQALALSEEAPEWTEESDDALQPPPEMAHVQPLIAALFSELPEAGVVKATKRKAPASDGAAAKKSKGSNSILVFCYPP